MRQDIKSMTLEEITQAYFTIAKSRKFISDLRRIRKEFQGRPTPISHLERLSDKIGTGVQLYVKREDLNHTGAHKLNHCMGEALLAKVAYLVADTADNAADEAKHAAFFEQFFADGGAYKRFAVVSNSGFADVLKVGKGDHKYKVGLTITIDTPSLRRYLEEAGVLVALNKGFN